VAELTFALPELDGLDADALVVGTYSSPDGMRLAPGAEAADAALGPLRGILAHIDDAIKAGAGSAERIRDRFAEILEAGRTDHIVLQIPVGDMTFDEAKRTMDVFCSDVKPELEAAA